MTAVRILRTSVAAVTVAGALAAVAPARAQTATPQPQSTLVLCKAVGNQEIANRLAILSALRGTVGGAVDVSSAHRTALLNLIDSDRTGLGSLDSAIQHDSTLSQCRSDVQAIVTRFRVYVLVVPQVHLVIAADVLTSVGTTFAGLEAPLAAAIQAATLNDGQRQRATQALNDLRASVTAAAAALAGQASTVLSLTPAHYPGTITTLQGVRSNLKAARADLGKARADFDVIADVLGRR